MVHVLNVAGRCKGAEDSGGEHRAGRAQAVQSEAGQCCCLPSPTSAVLVAGVALQLAPVPVALSVITVGMSNYCIFKSIFVAV